jgi:hypothetical protein
MTSTHRAGRWLLLPVAACLLLGCKKTPPAGSLEGFAVSFIDAAREGTPGSGWVDDQLVLRVRRAQRLKIAQRGGASPETLDKVWNEDPDPGAAGDRGSKQRERAAQAVRMNLKGSCRAERDPEGARKRVAMLTLPVEHADASRDELAHLADALKGADLARVQCEHGAVGILAVPRDGSFRVVDLFQINENKSPIPLGNPTAP